MFFDEQENLIIKELIKDPRISDNQISRKTKVALKTVNRKRKLLEEKGILHYFTYVENGMAGTGNFGARQLYIIKFRHGISRELVISKIKGSSRFTSFNIKHILNSYIGEVDGYVTLVMIIESRVKEDIVEIFNVEMVQDFKDLFGKGAIKETKVIDLTVTLRMLHNYIPLVNIEKGRMKQNWPDSKIFVE